MKEGLLKLNCCWMGRESWHAIKKLFNLSFLTLKVRNNLRGGASKARGVVGMTYQYSTLKLFDSCIFHLWDDILTMPPKYGIPTFRKTLINLRERIGWLDMTCICNIPSLKNRHLYLKLSFYQLVNDLIAFPSHGVSSHHSTLDTATQHSCIGPFPEHRLITCPFPHWILFGILCLHMLSLHTLCSFKSRVYRFSLFSLGYITY